LYDNQCIKNINESNVVNEQQLFPGGSPDSGQLQRRGGQPEMAPPDFIPQLPNELRQPFFGTPNRLGTGQQYQNRPGFNRDGQRQGSRRMRTISGCINRFTFLWLINGNSFWFYPVFVGDRQITGFRWSRGNWVYDRINIRRILYFQCF
jgi:hypothetical protein